MWFFASPQVIFGEFALDYLANIEGSKALIVTDENMAKLGLVERIQGKLGEAGLETAVFAEVEPNPTYRVVRRGAAFAAEHQPDWIVGLGGGSALDAAKAIFALYERPDLGPGDLNPVIRLGLGQKAKLLTIPTTSGTGAEVTWLVVLTDEDAQRKLVLGSRENVADLSIVDPSLAIDLPPGITADTGMDALTHAVEGYTCIWRNDFSDGLCLKAAQLVFDYLPRAYELGARDPEAREKMHNAASIAGLGFGNSNGALAHALGHPMSPAFGVPHGRAVGLFLPYTIQFTATEMGERYAELARFLGLPAATAEEGTAALVRQVRDLARRIGQPLTVAELGIEPEAFEAALPKMVTDGLNDTVTSSRIPEEEEMEKLYRYAYAGKTIDF